MSPEWWIEAELACRDAYDDWDAKSDDERHNLIIDWVLGND